jgi:hypothetical protein
MLTMAEQVGASSLCWDMTVLHRNQLRCMIGALKVDANYWFKYAPNNETHLERTEHRTRVSRPPSNVSLLALVL